VRHLARGDSLLANPHFSENVVYICMFRVAMEGGPHTLNRYT
jgi:hypothetical protein